MFPNIAQNIAQTCYILTVKITDINELNLKIQHDIPGDMRTCKSVDTATNEDYVVNYPQ